MNRFLNLDGNDQLSLLRGEDLREFLILLQQYFLEYRECLNLPKALTFGVEIEYEKVFRFIVDRFIEQELPTWDSRVDGSIIFGGEIVSPKMSDLKECWQNLKKVSDVLAKKRADTYHNAGGLF